jgi:hypothetical protein
MSIEMANKLPLPWIQRRHVYGDHLPWIEWYGGCVETIVVDVIAVPMGYVCVKAHIPEVPDGSVINAHFEGRVVCENVTVYLVIVRKCQIFAVMHLIWALTGKKFAAISVVTLVFGVLIIWGYQRE